MNTYEQYKKFIQTLYAPTDTLCFCAIQKDKAVLHDFVPFDKAASADYFAKLQWLNTDYSLYIAMNPFKAELQNQKTGRKKENVAAIKRLYVDIDKNGEAVLQQIQNDGIAVPPPNVVLNSSPGKFQFIWNVNGLNQDTAETLLKNLVRKYDGDPACAEVARVLRIPGLVNRKYDSLPVVGVVGEMFPDVFAPTDFNFEKVETATVVPQGFHVVEDDPSEVIPRGADGRVPDGFRHKAIMRELGHWHNDGMPLDYEKRFDKIYEWTNANCAPASSDTHRREHLKQCVLYSLKMKPATQLAFNQKPDPGPAGSTPTIIDWPEPLPLGDELRPVMPFDINFLPVSIQDHVRDVSERMGASIDMCAVSALAVLAGSVGRRAFVYPKGQDKSWKEAIVIPTVFVAHSGEKKTPVQEAFIAAANSVQGDWFDEYKQIQARFASAKEHWEMVQQDNDAEKKAAKKEKREPVLDMTPHPENVPPRRRLVLNDATPEVMHDILIGNPSGILFHRDELSGWVVELDMKGRELEREYFLDAMSGNKRRTVDRLCRDGGLAWMCATVFGCFQPDTLREFLGQARDIGNGLVPRFHIFVWPDYHKVKSVDRPVNELASSAFKHLVKTLAEMPTESVELHFSPEAQELWYKLRDENDDKQQAETNHGKRSHLAKYGGALPKIAALYQLVDFVASGRGAVTKRVANLETGKLVTENVDAVPDGRLIISTEYLERAARFMKYLESHMHRVYDSKLNQAQLAGSIIARNIKNGTLLSDPTRGGLLARDVVRARLCDDTRIATNGLEELENKRWVQGIPFKPTVGRPTTVWVVNPKVFLLP